MTTVKIYLCSSLLSVSGGICSLIYGIYNVQRDDTVRFFHVKWK